MQISMTKARAHWHEVVRRAEAGEEVVLTRDRRPIVVITAEKRRDDPKA
jgi:prevent-host-death family protein